MTQDTRAFNWNSIPVKTGATADPAAGNNPADVTVPAGKRWLLMSGRCQFVADATVITRNAMLQVLRDGTNVECQAYGNDITAGQTRGTNLTQGIGLSAVLLTDELLGVGLQEIPAAGIIRINYYNIQAGDNAGPLRYSYKEVPV